MAWSRKRVQRHLDYAMQLVLKDNKKKLPSQTVKEKQIRQQTRQPDIKNNNQEQRSSQPETAPD